MVNTLFWVSIGLFPVVLLVFIYSLVMPRRFRVERSRIAQKQIIQTEKPFKETTFSLKEIDEELSIFNIPEEKDQWINYSTDKIVSGVVDPIFGNHIACWKERHNRSMNATFYALESKLNMREIFTLSKYDDIKQVPRPSSSSEYNPWFYHENLKIRDTVLREALETFKRDKLYVMEEEENKVGVCSIFAALRIIRKYSANTNDWTIGYSDFLDASRQFLTKECWSQKDSNDKRIFPEKPTADDLTDTKETIFTIYNGLASYLCLFSSKKYSSRSDDEVKIFNDVANRINDYRWQSNTSNTHGIEFFSYSYEENSIPCVSALFHALRSTEFVDALIKFDTFPKWDQPQRGGNLIAEAIKTPYNKGYLRFIEVCIDLKTKGFRYTIDSEEADIIHNRYSLQTLRLLLLEGGIDKKDLTWLPASDIAEFILSCYCLGGFSTYSTIDKLEPKVVAPALMTTMAALDSFKLLEIFRLNGVFSADNEYLRARNKLFNLYPKIEKYIQYSEKLFTAVPSYLPFPDIDSMEKDLDILVSLNL